MQDSDRVQIGTRSNQPVTELIRFNKLNRQKHERKVSCLPFLAQMSPSSYAVALYVNDKQVPSIFTGFTNETAKAVGGHLFRMKYKKERLRRLLVLLGIGTRYRKFFKSESYLNFGI